MFIIKLLLDYQLSFCWMAGSCHEKIGFTSTGTTMRQFVSWFTAQTRREAAWVQTPALSLTSCVTSDKLLNLSGL